MRSIRNGSTNLTHLLESKCRQYRGRVQKLIRSTNHKLYRNCIWSDINFLINSNTSRRVCGKVKFKKKPFRKHGIFSHLNPPYTNRWRFSSNQIIFHSDNNRKLVVIVIIVVCGLGLFISATHQLHAGSFHLNRGQKAHTSDAAVAIAHLLWHGFLLPHILSVSIQTNYTMEFNSKRHIGKIAVVRSSSSSSDDGHNSNSSNTINREHCVTKYAWSESNEEDCAFVVLFFFLCINLYIIYFLFAPCPSLALSTIPSNHERCHKL